MLLHTQYTMYERLTVTPLLTAQLLKIIDWVCTLRASTLTAALAKPSALVMAWHQQALCDDLNNTGFLSQQVGKNESPRRFALQKVHSHLDRFPVLHQASTLAGIPHQHRCQARTTTGNRCRLQKAFGRFWLQRRQRAERYYNILEGFS